MELLSQLTLFICLIVLPLFGQLFLCLNIKNIIIKLMPTIITLTLTIYFYFKTFSNFGWDSFGYAFLYLGFLFIFISDVVGWIIFGIIKFINYRKNKKI